jgi:hypothetical protein
VCRSGRGGGAGRALGDRDGLGPRLPEGCRQERCHSVGCGMPPASPSVSGRPVAEPTLSSALSGALPYASRKPLSIRPWWLSRPPASAATMSEAPCSRETATMALFVMGISSCNELILILCPTNVSISCGPMVFVGGRACYPAASGPTQTYRKFGPGMGRAGRVGPDASAVIQHTSACVVFKSLI